MSPQVLCLGTSTRPILYLYCLLNDWMLWSNYLSTGIIKKARVINFKEVTSYRPHTTSWQWSHLLDGLRKLLWQKYFWNFKSKWTLPVEIRLQIGSLPKYPSSGMGFIVAITRWHNYLGGFDFSSQIFPGFWDFSCNDFTVLKVLLPHRYGKTDNWVHNNMLTCTER